jgi:sucrose phosphorylase
LELQDTLGTTTFFNFLASHDGIGLLPAKGILSEEEIEGLVDNTREQGGFINYKSTPEGDVPYEMNITYLDALAGPNLPVSVRTRKFLAGQSVMLTLRGVPGIYIHSLIGSENYGEGVKQTGENRTINREKLSYSEVMNELNTPGTLRNRIFSGFQDMLKARRRENAFHPAGRMEILPTGKDVMCILRISPDNTEYVLAFISVNPGLTTVEIPINLLPKPLKTNYTELIRGNSFTALLTRNSLQFQLTGFGVYWLK